MKAHLVAVAAAVVAVSGALLVHSSAEAQGTGGGAYLGEVITVPYNYCPKGWVAAQGQILPINQNQALFSLMGTTYGGDGRATFALPHLKTIESKNGAPLLQCIAMMGVWPSRT